MCNYMYNFTCLLFYTSCVIKSIPIIIGKSSIQQEDSFHQQTGLKFKEETSKVLHLERSFVWC
jgi:hypothetical protein